MTSAMIRVWVVAVWSLAIGGVAWGCRYSIRDVAFVDVHGTPWQLHLVRPPGAADRTGTQGAGEGSPLESWQRVVTEQFVDSNVQSVWFDADSVKGKQVASLFDKLSLSQPCMAVVDQHGMLTKVAPSSEGFATTIEQLVDSPVRSRILDAVAESLCVILVVEGDDPTRVAEVDKITSSAVRRAKDQMWMLEKPTRIGPVIVPVPFDQRLREKWLLKSLGIEATDRQIAVAIVFGQGRRLGPVLYGDEIATETIVARASLCGRDCECDLDRRWLYGPQMIHRWSDRRRRAVEDALDFDPYSAMVVAEVHQIVRKGSDAISPDVVDLGPGLQIHDLPPVDGGTTDRAGAGPRDAASLPAGPSRPPETHALHDESSGVPWRLLLGLTGAAVLLAVRIWWRAKRKHVQ